MTATQRQALPASTGILRKFKATMKHGRAAVVVWGLLLTAFVLGVPQMRSHAQAKQKRAASQEGMASSGQTALPDAAKTTGKPGRAGSVLNNLN
jgi:hypothetical protein